MKNLKYIAVGILVGYLGLYVYELSQQKDKGKRKLSDYDSDTEK
jgi:hypothetical protein